MKEYALYKGDEILSIGTIPEIAKEMGLKEHTISFYKTESYLNRLRRRNSIDGNVRILIPLDEEES